MYSKNDYRYYLEHRLVESDDYLAHYGVKGMKWKHRKGGNTIHIPIITDLDAPARRAAQEYKVRQEIKKAEDKKLKNRIKKKLKPKNQKVTVITDSKRKRSKKEAKWNKEMQSYGKEYLSSQNKKSSAKKRKMEDEVFVASNKAIDKTKQATGMAANRLANRKRSKKRR